VVSQQEKGELQAKIDQLDNDQLERVIDFLKLDNSEGQEIQVDLDALPPARRLALIRFVDAELHKASSKAGALGAGDTGVGVPLLSPAFPVLEPGATPLAVATPLAAAMTPRREPENGPTACAAKRQLAWEVCSAREVQRQSHLREVREAASVGGTPQSLTPAAVEAAGQPPELVLPAAQEPPERGPPRLPGGPAPEARPLRAPEPETLAAAATGDSMLESAAEVLDMVDFGWM